MPVVTTVAFDTLLERGGSGSNHKRIYDSRQQRHQMREGSGNGTATAEVRKKPSVYRFSPALYATPEPTQISSSSPTPTSVSPSPYVVNHKRREFRPRSSPNGVSEDCLGQLDVGLGEEGSERGRNGKREEEKVAEEENERALNGNFGGRGLANGGGDDGRVEKEEAGDDDLDDFFIPRESLSVISSSDTEDGDISHCHVLGKCTSTLNISEFFDATEDFFSDGSASQASPFQASVEADLRHLRLNLFEEIERRKNIEESFIHMQNLWKNMATCFSQLGLSFPPIPDGSSTQHETDSVEQVCQEIIVGRFVSEALERGLARAEAEAYAEVVIESKNNEITRLHDRLHYYEVVNHEMSQRNQEAIELARRKREKRRIQQRWIYGSIGLSITIGASLLAYSFMPQGSKGGHSLFGSDEAEPSSTL